MIAAVRVVLPWSMWPMVPTLTCGLVRSKLPFAIAPRSSLLTGPRPHEFGCGAPLNSVPSQSCCWDLNPGPPPYQGGALPTELQQHEPMDAPAGNPAVAFHTSRKTSRPAPHRAQSLNCEV